MGHRYQNILETVGRTPVVRINRLAPAGVNLFVKVEAFNPLGSVKDRLAETIFADATCGTIRLKLLKIGALVRISVRRIRIAMASACPTAREWGQAVHRLANARAAPT